MTKLRKFTPALFLGILAAALITNCATRREVQQIVTDSNAAILSSQLGADADVIVTVKGKGKSNALDAASARIDAFIAAHPDQPATAAALRIRQAMLLLSAGEPELARASFSQAAAADLHSPRDRTLKEISTNLVWWFRGASMDAFNPEDYTSASNALRTLLNSQRNLTVLVIKDPEVEGIRGYVAETRAWIGLRYASALPRAQANAARSAFLDTLTNYVESLGSNSTRRLGCGCKCDQAELPSAITLELRRCFRSREVLKYAFEVRRDTFGENPPQLPEPSSSLVQDWR